MRTPCVNASRPSNLPRTGQAHNLRLVGALWSAVVVLLLALQPGVGTAYAQAQSADPVPVDEYWRRIDAIAESLDGVERDAPSIAAAADELASIGAVVLPDGQVLPVDNGDLAAILRGDDLSQDDLQAVCARLAALQRARGMLDKQPTLTTDQTFAQLEKILARSEFDQATERAQRVPLLERAADWLWRKLFPWLDRAASQPGVESLLSLISVAVVLGVLAFVFRDSWRQWAAEGRSKRKGKAGEDATLNSSEALERAHTLAGADDYRQAVRYLYLSTLLWLDERRLLHYDPTLTNREFLHQVMGHARLYKALLPVVDIFDQVWYGFVPLDSRGYAVYARQVEQVQNMDGAE